MNLSLVEMQFNTLRNREVRDLPDSATQNRNVFIRLVVEAPGIEPGPIHVQSCAVLMQVVQKSARLLTKPGSPTRSRVQLSAVLWNQPVAM